MASDELRFVCPLCLWSWSSEEAMRAHIPASHNTTLDRFDAVMEEPTNAINYHVGVNERLTAEVERLTRDSCVDCGSPVLICDHAAKNLLDPERSFHAGQIEEMTTERDALAAQVAALREAGAVLAEYVEHQPFSLARMAAIEAWRAALAAAGGED